MNSKIFTYFLFPLACSSLLASCGGTTCKVQFDSNGGTAVAEIVVKKNSKLSKPTSPTKENRNFVSWYKDKDCNEVFDFTETITSDTTLYAGWGCEVTFSNEGVETTYPSENILENHYAYNPGLPTATETDKHCFGWKKDEEYFVFDENPITEPITLKPALVTSYEALVLQQTKDYDFNRNIGIDDHHTKKLRAYSSVSLTDYTDKVSWDASSYGDNITINKDTGEFYVREGAPGGEGLITAYWESTDVPGKVYSGSYEVVIASFNKFACYRDDEKLTTIIDNADYGSKGKIVFPSAELCRPYGSTNYERYSVTGFKDNAFENFTEITEIVINDLRIYTSFSNISKCAFKGCTKLAKATLPASVTKINESAFEGCTSLSEIIYEGTIDAFKEAIKDSTNWKKGTPTIRVQCSDGEIVIE